MQDPTPLVKENFLLLERGPITFVAAFFAAAFFVLLVIHLRHVEKAKKEQALLADAKDLEIASLNAKQAAEVASLNAKQAAEVRELHESELRRAIRFESTVRGLVLVAEANGLSVKEKRSGRRRKPTTNPGMEPDAPTLLISGLEGKLPDE